MISESKIIVRYQETDQMGIVHHSNYIRWFEEARLEMLRAMGLPYKKMEDNGILIPVDDESALQGQLRRIAREKRWTDGSVGRFLYDFFEQLIARDLHRLEKIEDRIEALEDRVLAHELDEADWDDFATESQAVQRPSTGITSEAKRFCGEGHVPSPSSTSQIR